MDNSPEFDESGENDQEDPDIVSEDLADDQVILTEEEFVREFQEKYSWLFIDWAFIYEDYGGFFCKFFPEEEGGEIEAIGSCTRGYGKPLTGPCISVNNSCDLFNTWLFPIELPDGRIRLLPFIHEPITQWGDPATDKFFLLYDEMPTIDPKTMTGYYFYDSDDPAKPKKKAEIMPAE